MNPLGTTTSNGEDQDTRSHRRRLRWFILPALTVLWLGLVGIGMSAMWKYQVTPGEVTKSLQHWPAGSQIERNANRTTLVMFAHPHCPCTRATINELALIMAHCAGHIDVSVLFFKPTHFPENWEQTDLWFSAAEIPGVKVFSDHAGAEAMKFHAKTSGYSLLFDENGQLLFRGGITGSQDHGVIPVTMLVEVPLNRSSRTEQQKRIRLSLSAALCWKKQTLAIRSINNV